MVEFSEISGSFCGGECAADSGEGIEGLSFAIQVLLKLRDIAKNEPLSNKELKSMDGCAVWVEGNFGILSETYDGITVRCCIFDAEKSCFLGLYDRYDMGFMRRIGAKFYRRKPGRLHI